MGAFSRDPKSPYSGLDFSDGPLRQPPLEFAVPLTPPPSFLAEQMAAPRRNISEKERLQALMRPASMISVGGSERAVSPVGYMSKRNQFRAWMVNEGTSICLFLFASDSYSWVSEGSRRIFVGVWVFLHGLVFALGYLNYSRKDNLNNVRALFGVGYPIARSAALVLHFDVAFIMFPICRNFISLLRRGPLNGVIPFEKNITFHKAVAWSIVFFSFVHVGAHVVNVYWLVCSLTSSTSERIKAYILTNLITGPGLTGWIMNVCLAIMVWYARDSKKKTNFEKFWYSHHLFIDISVHIRCVGDFTKAFAEALGCDLGKKDKDSGAQVVPPPLTKTLPRVMVDGPFGSASEDVFKFEVSVLVGAGIGVTPFASILKTIWYRLNFPQGRRTRLSKVYFFWICRDYDSFEWFQSLLLAIEEQDLENRIEIHTYLTARVKEDDINNIYVQDVGGQHDTITNLRAPTHPPRRDLRKIWRCDSSPTSRDFSAAPLEVSFQAGMNNPLSPDSHTLLPQPKLAFPASAHIPSSQTDSTPTGLARFVQLFKGDNGAIARRSSTSGDTMARVSVGRSRERERSATLPSRGKGVGVVFEDVDEMGKGKMSASSSTQNLSSYRFGSLSSSVGTGQSPSARGRSGTAESASSHASTFFVKGHSAKNSHTRTFSGASTAPTTPSESAYSFHSGGKGRSKTSTETMRRGSPNLVDPRFSTTYRGNAGKSPAPGALALGTSFGGPRLFRSHSFGGGGTGESFVASLANAPLLDSQGHDTSPTLTRPDSQQVWRPPSPHPFQAAEPIRRGSLPVLSLCASPTHHSNPTSPAQPESRSFFQSPYLRHHQHLSPKAARPSASQPDLRSSAAATSSSRLPSKENPKTKSRHRSTSVSRILAPTHDDLYPSAPYGAVPVNTCEAYTFPHPRLAAVSPPSSPRSNFANGNKFEGAARSKGKGKQKEPSSTGRDVNFADDESVRRVLRETRASQLERTIWNEEGSRMSSRSTVRRRKERSRGRSESRARASGEEDGEEGLGLGIKVGRDGGIENRPAIRLKKEEKMQERERLERERMGESNLEGRGTRMLRGTPGSLEFSSRDHLRPPDDADLASSPISRSFDPLTALVGRVRRISNSRSQDRLSPNSPDVHRITSRPDSSWSTRLRSDINVGRKRSSSVLHPPPVLDRSLPIRQLRSSPSVDSLYNRPYGPTQRLPGRDDEEEEHLGQALTSPIPSSPARARIDPHQNAFLSLPPHLHHLLMDPKPPVSRRESFIPSRIPPPIPYDSPPFSASSPRFPPPAPRAPHFRDDSVESVTAMFISMDPTEDLGDYEVQEQLIYPASPPDSRPPSPDVSSMLDLDEEGSSFHDLVSVGFKITMET
ncbi:hypothetical protein P7C70_g2528, partial [Phenoliferia sp. Uapishka_3]